MYNGPGLRRKSRALTSPVGLSFGLTPGGFRRMMTHFEGLLYSLVLVAVLESVGDQACLQLLAIVAEVLPLSASVPSSVKQQ